MKVKFDVAELPESADEKFVYHSESREYYCILAKDYLYLDAQELSL